MEGGADLSRVTPPTLAECGRGGGRFQEER